MSSSVAPKPSPSRPPAPLAPGAVGYTCPRCGLRAGIAARRRTRRPLEALALSIVCPECVHVDHAHRHRLAGAGGGERRGLGAALGWLVGALLGSAFLLLGIVVGVMAVVALGVAGAAIAAHALREIELEDDLERLGIEVRWRPPETVTLGEVVRVEEAGGRMESSRIFEPLRCVVAEGETLYVAGDQGVIVRRGGLWDMEHPTGVPLRAIAKGPDAFYAVGPYAILRREGSGWASDVAAGHDGNHDTVFSDGRHIWVGGWFGRIFRREGPQRWVEEPTDLRDRVTAIHGGGGSLWAVTDHGLALRRMASGRWRTERVPAEGRFNAVWVDGPDDVWIVGDAGVALRRQSGRWSHVKLPLPERPDLFAVFRVRGATYIGGEKGVLVRIREGGPPALVPLPSRFDLRSGAPGPGGHVFLVGSVRVKRSSLHPPALSSPLPPAPRRGSTDPLADLPTSADRGAFRSR